MAEISDAVVVRMLRRIAERIEREKDHLCDLDSAVGDGDHGVSLTIGMRAVTRNLDELGAPSAAAAFRSASEAFADEVGAAIGPIYEELLAAAASVLDRHDVAARDTWVQVFEAIASATQAVGGARPGDKTLVDAWVPAAAAMRREADEGADLATCLASASRAAWQGVADTKDLVPRLGRASRLGERARGHPDAGATSTAILIEVMRDELTAAAGGGPPP
jgi:phosphoenolpyruvate---glycerone phosphotransferase subunit DhaL